MALYLPFFAGAGPSLRSSVIECLPFSTLVPFDPLMGRGISSVKPGAIFAVLYAVRIWSKWVVGGFAYQDTRVE